MVVFTLAAILIYQMKLASHSVVCSQFVVEFHWIVLWIKLIVAIKRNKCCVYMQ